MASQAVKEYLEGYDVVKFKALKRPDLLQVASELKLGEVRSTMRKAEIKRRIVEYLVDEEIYEEAVLQDFPAGEVTKPNELEILRAEMEKIKLQSEASQLEIEKMRLQREIEGEQHNRKLEMAKVAQVSERQFVASRELRMVPVFHESDVDKYFMHFEKVAIQCDWPKPQWPIMLQSVLKGKAQSVYASLEDCSDYDKVKECILKAYELVPEAYRQKFRNQRKAEQQSHLEFVREKKNSFDRWLKAKKVGEEFGKLKEVILMEEFRWKVQDSVRSYLDEKEVEDIESAAKLADDFVLTHKKSLSNGGKRGFGSHGFKSMSNDSEKASGNGKEQPKAQGQDRNDSSGGPAVRRGPTCYHCKKPGHIMANCLALKRKREQKEQDIVKPGGLVSVLGSTGITDSSLEMVKPMVEEKDGDVENSIAKGYQPFVSKGLVSVKKSSPVSVAILRDTGASQSLMLSSVVDPDDDSFTGEFVVCKGIEGKTVSVPLHSVHLKSDLVTGQVRVGLMPTLPMRGISFLLGNDLAGGEVVPAACLTNRPTIEEEIADSELFPSCAVTRAMSQGFKEDPVSCKGDKDIDTLTATLDEDVVQDPDDVGLSGTFFQNIDENEKVDETVQLVSDTLSLSRKKLIEYQENDPEIRELKEKALDKDEIQRVPVGYYVDNGVLMRKFRPPEVSVEDVWTVVNQIVVPKVYRKEIIAMAHDLPLGGHLGVNKTVEKILKQFFWPGLRSEVAQFCRGCHTCQMVGKYKADPPVAPLHPIPVFGEPFSRVVIDCVGPLPKTKSGNQYLLTVMCANTRYPEAFPLRNIRTPSITKVLMKFFTTFGLPREVQSDQGSNFTSGLFQQVLYELGIKQITSSAYHPESQGVLERFHSTLKVMMRMYCYENEKDWDEGIPLLLFAARESVQESLGFSPFELVFGHRVRGPLNLISEQWSNEKVEIGLLDYVVKFKERLRRTWEMAHEKLGKNQSRMKTWYDRKARLRVFKPGDRVLVLFPLQSNPLCARFHGPYEIDKRVGEVDYLVKTPDRRKPCQLCHVNMLKEYVGRDQKGVAACSKVEHSEEVKEEEVKKEVTSTCKLSNSEVLERIDEKLTHLNEEQRKTMMALVLKYRDIFPDVPRCTTIAEHDVDVGDARPIKQHPYRMNPDKRELAETEVEYMLKHNIIRPSSSSWSSPCVLVPKPNGSVRFCTDYRKVNAITKTDVFPIPRVDDCIDRIGSAKYLTKMDLLKGYWCVPLTERGREISAFVTSSGLYEYNVLPFGMKNAPATFQRMMESVVQGLEHTHAYIDDLITRSDTWEEHVKNVEELFERLAQARLTVNLGKSEFGCGTVMYLGHEIGQGKVAPIDAKVKAILAFPTPTDRKSLRRFLGMIGYYRKFCNNFAQLALPLTNLLKGGVKFVWSDACQRSLEALKNVLCHYPVLRSPDFTKGFSLAIDASDEAAGAVLLQKSEDDSSIEHPVAYYSRKFDKHQKNYSTVEKESLALVLALQHFEVYISSEKPLIVHTDHNPLVFLSKMKTKNRRLLSWSLMLQEYNLEIRHIRGKDNVLADTLSRC